MHEAAKAKTVQAADATSASQTLHVAGNVSSGPSAGRELLELDPGTRTGRFRIVEVLGRGAMGIVYRAYDPALGRHVALKVPRADHCRRGQEQQPQSASECQRSQTSRARFVKEAQGIAQLSHANVVKVFGIERFCGVPGLRDGARAIAMEVVEGTTLERWMRTDRPWQSVVAAFAEAGRGLASAHAAGLVHRDFKPSNVAVGRDGRARVMDFGLVMGERQAPPVAVPTVDADGDATLTQTGMTLGTPAYMAPEQHVGDPLDHRTDQFSFCVALFEALFGQRPYRGGSCRRLSSNKQLGKRTKIGSGHRVPPHVVAAIIKGLSPLPRDRFASMDALLRALGRPARRRTWRAAAACIALALLGVGAGAGAMALPCPGAPTSHAAAR